MKAFPLSPGKAFPPYCPATVVLKHGRWSGFGATSNIARLTVETNGQMSLRLSRVLSGFF